MYEAVIILTLQNEVNLPVVSEPAGSPCTSNAFVASSVSQENYRKKLYIKRQNSPASKQAITENHVWGTEHGGESGSQANSPGLTEEGKIDKRKVSQSASMTIFLFMCFKRLSEAMLEHHFYSRVSASKLYSF